MECFENQKALLEYLNRNPEDRKWVKRRMEEGLIWKEWWMFYLSDKIDWFSYKGKKEKKSEWDEVKETVVADSEELVRLKKENEEMVAKYKKLAEKYNDLLERFNIVKEKASAEWGLYDHLVYFYGKFQERKKFVEGKVFWEAEHKKSLWTQDTMETVRPYMYERYKFTYDEEEKAEEEAVKKIIAKRAEEIAQMPF